MQATPLSIHLLLPSPHQDHHRPGQADVLLDGAGRGRAAAGPAAGAGLGAALPGSSGGRAARAPEPRAPAGAGGRDGAARAHAGGRRGHLQRRVAPPLARHAESQPRGCRGRLKRSARGLMLGPKRLLLLLGGILALQIGTGLRQQTGFLLTRDPSLSASFEARRLLSVRSRPIRCPGARSAYVRAERRSETSIQFLHIYKDALRVKDCIFGARLRRPLSCPYA